MTTESVRGRFYKFDVGDRLRAAREIAGLSQEELSQLTGISRQTISNYELGISKKPKPPYLAAIALATNFDRNWLEHGTEPPDPEGPNGTRNPSRVVAEPTGQKGDLSVTRLVHLLPLGLVAAHPNLLPCSKFAVSLTQADVDQAA